MKVGTHERLLVSLAQLSFEQKLDKQAKSYFLKLIESSGIWSAWFQRLLKFKRLFIDAEFVKKLSFEVARKKTHPKKIIEKLIAYTKQHNLPSCTDLLSNCLKKNKL